LILKTRVPAKINLWLEVIRKREDGYHDLSSLMVPVSVFDEIGLDVAPGGDGITLSCTSPEIPADDRNLAWRAVDLFLRKSGLKARVDIALEKHIPSGAGLGGGSSDAGGVLVALNSFFDDPLSQPELEAIALTLGADVPFFLHCRAALATGIGEKLEFARGVPAYPLLLIKPPISVPTGWVYQNLKLTSGRPQITLSGLNASPWEIGSLAQNDLESVTVLRYPVIEDLKGWLLSRGALAASMSGSGPTVFGVFASTQAVAEAEDEARKAWSDCWIQAARVMESS
jgi:4-diphosphocytidyl-2-C-methyl-D-erythritol kinase